MPLIMGKKNQQKYKKKKTKTSSPNPKHLLTSKKSLGKNCISGILKQ